MHVSVGQWIAILVFAGILLLATVNVRRQWRGERPPPGTSERTLRGRPSVVVVGWLMLVGVALTIVGTNVGEPGATIVAVVLALVLVALVMTFPLWGLTFATGCPGFAIPPLLRRRSRDWRTYPDTWHIPGTYRVRAQSRSTGNACNDKVVLSDRDITRYRVRADRSR